MASFEDAKQALMDGIPVVVRHRGESPVLVATWEDRAALVENYAADPPRIHETDALTRDQVEKLRRLGAKNELDSE